MSGLCRQCKHWQGNRLSRWGDCYHIIFDILPLDYTDRYGEKCSAPLDPHDLQYYLSNSGIHKDMHHSMLDRLPYGVRKQTPRESIYWMDDHGEQTVTTKKLTYLQTHRHFECERFTDD